jgi:uncharacterized membrane protein
VLLGAAAALTVPGFGPLVAAGILASALGGAVIGAATGGLVGALVQLGLPEEEARFYEEQLRAGHPVVTVKANGRFYEAHAILRRFGAITYGAEQAAPAP